MATTSPEPTSPDGQAPVPKKKRNAWIWICAVLAVVAAGLLIWALSLNSDLDSTQKQVEGAKGVAGDLSAQLGATNEDLEDTQKDLDGQKQATADAEKAADDAKDAAGKAKDETDELKAEADQAQAEVKVAESKAAIATDCAKAYVSAFGSALDGNADVRGQLQSITADCKTALADA